MPGPPPAGQAAILWAVACALAAISSLQRRFGPCRARTSQGPSALLCSPSRLLTTWLAFQAVAYALAAPTVSPDAVNARTRATLASIFVQVQLVAALAVSALALLLLEPQNPLTRRAYLYLCTLSVLGASAVCAVLSARANPQPPPPACTWLALSGQMAALCAIVCAFLRMRDAARNSTHERVPTKSGAVMRDSSELGRDPALVLAPVPWAGKRDALPGRDTRGGAGGGGDGGGGAGSSRGSESGHSPHARVSFTGRPATWRPHLCGLVGSVLLLGAHALLAVALYLSGRAAGADPAADVDNLVLAAAALATAVALPLLATAVGWLGQPEHFTVVPSTPICGYLCGRAGARGGARGAGRSGGGMSGSEWGSASESAPAVGVLERATTDAHILRSQGLFLSTPSMHSTRTSRGTDSSLRSSTGSTASAPSTRSSTSSVRTTPTPPPASATPVVTCRAQAHDATVVESDGMTSAVAMMHASTAPPAYYKTQYGVDDGMNMDRGAFSRCADGSIAACIFDGVTLGGRINAHAAQAFSSFTIGWLEKHLHKVFASNIEEFTHNLFSRAQSQENNPGRADRAKDAEGGAATGGYVLLRPQRLDTAAAASRRRRGRAARLKGVASMPPSRGDDDDVFAMRGAVIGDVAVIIVNGDAAETRQVNNVHRATMQGRTDTGGQLNMCGDISGELSCFESTITTSEILILATDGLTDNLREDCMSEIVHLLVRAPCFDEPQVRPCPWVVRQGVANGEVEGHLPTPEELMQYIHASLPNAILQPLEDFSDVTSLAVTKRLTNYLSWVTGPKRDEEQRYYEALGELNVCEHRLRDGADRDADGASNGKGQREDETTKQRLEDLSRELANMRKSRRSSPVAGKTDDCLVIAIRPTLDTPTGNLMQARHTAPIAEESTEELCVSSRRGGAESQRGVAVPASTVTVVDASSVV